MMEKLVDIYRGPTYSVSVESGDYILRSIEFQSLSEPVDVLNRAERVVRRLTGLLKLFANFGGEAWPENAIFTEHDGRTWGIGTTVRGSGSVYSPDGIEQLRRIAARESNESLGVRLASLASVDPDVAKCLELASDGPITWSQVYMLLEVLKHRCGGFRGIAKHGWSSEAVLRRIQATANAYRHAVPKARGPRNPVPYNEAVITVRHAIVQWLGEACEVRESPGQHEIAILDGR